MRNENGYGTIVCLDKTGKKRKKPFGVRITSGWSPEGKQQYKYLSFHATEREAQRALKDYNRNKDVVAADSYTITFEQLFQLWRTRNENKMTKTNLQAYTAVYNLVPQLHKCKMKDLKSTHLQVAMDSVNRKHGSKAKLKSLMNQMYELGILDDLVMKNYSKGINLNCVQEESGNIFTPDEITHLWTLSGKNKTAEDILILIYTGMRIREALGVIPHMDVHLDENYIACHGTKTKSSDRPIPIHPDIKPILERRMGYAKLFQNTRGQGVAYRTFAYHYNGLMESLGWNHIIHDTRKTFITILHENNIPMEDISSIVGHKQKTITARVYLRTSVQHLVNKMVNVVFPKP